MAFMRALKRAGVNSVSVRRARGSEEGAACGQLRNNLKKTELQKKLSVS